MNLYDKKHDVLVIDKDTNRVQEIKDKVTQAVVADATDIKTLETLAIKEIESVKYDPNGAICFEIW